MKLTSWLGKWNNAGLLVLRLAIAVMFIVHGLNKWSMWGMEPSEQLQASMLTIMKILSIAEPLAGLAMIIGYLTPVAAIGLIAEMLGAVNLKVNVLHLRFTEAQSTGWELEFMIIAALVCLLFTGPGRFSIEGRRTTASS